MKFFIIPRQALGRILSYSAIEKRRRSRHRFWRRRHAAFERESQNFKEHACGLSRNPKELSSSSPVGTEEWESFASLTGTGRTWLPRGWRRPVSEATCRECLAKRDCPRAGGRGRPPPQGRLSHNSVQKHQRQPEYFRNFAK